ncbi:proteasomal ubiquitin receptor ADRM1 homolog [Nilaparvata lugens]|uniref:proteasomal ubiquitin receptor ADRM1 homolog n=1 Tax=Nilaparvata lugens TaxID=108931 RepID=UPI00193DB779|nr:proteasomal ubiquitin receptor ADRM1 homolog [Nilaparvata lugens]
MPTGGALFGSSSSRSQNKNLVEFKAGKMTMKGKMVHPDKRKGLLYVNQSEDSLMHFCWKDRQTGTVEDDLIIFPDDCEFKRVPQCSTGRVYVLKFKNSSRKLFFWVQEPKTDKDEENCRRINDVLNNPPTLGTQRSGGGTPDGDLQNLLSNMSQQQLMQLFGGVNQIGGLSSILGTISRPSGIGQNSRPSPETSLPASPSSNTTSATATPASATSASAAPTTPATPAASKPATTTAASSKPASAAAAGSSQQNPIQLSDLQNFLTGLGVSGSSGAASNVDLSSAITADSLQAVLSDPSRVRDLQPHLPSIPSTTGHNQQEQLRSTLASPQFQQAVSMFSTALQSGQLGPVVSQFAVGPEAVNAANQGNMEEFVKALQNATINNPDKPDDASSSDSANANANAKDAKGKKKDGGDDEDLPLD